MSHEKEPEDKWQHIAFKVPPELVASARNLAAARRVSFSHIFREALIEYLERNDATSGDDRPKRKGRAARHDPRDVDASAARVVKVGTELRGEIQSMVREEIRRWREPSNRTNNRVGRQFHRTTRTATDQLIDRVLDQKTEQRKAS